jgi:hypothetical protein
MPAELVTQARLPISDLEQQVRDKYGIKQKLMDFRLDGDALILVFAHEGKSPPDSSKTKATAAPASQSPLRRRRKAKRNRMKTRGWNVVGKFQLPNGQTTTIYEPFVKALGAGKLTRAEQKAAVTKILRDNGNRPEEGSIEYFLENTLAYLAKGGPG